MRSVLLAAGIASILSGSALLLTPLSAPVPLPLIPTLGGIALLGLLVGAYGLLERTRRSPTTATLPNRSERATVDAPGDAFDRALEAASPRDGSEDRAAIRNRLETAAVAVLADADGCSREAARRRLERGDWTDDESAAAVFADDVRPSASVRERLRRLVVGESAFEQRVGRAIDALADRRDEG